MLLVWELGHPLHSKFVKGFEDLLCTQMTTDICLCISSLSPYSAAKSYNLKFSHSLYNEMACENAQVDVVAMAPGQVVSGMNEGPPTTMVSMKSSLSPH